MMGKLLDCLSYLVVTIVFTIIIIVIIGVPDARNIFIILTTIVIVLWAFVRVLFKFFL